MSLLITLVCVALAWPPSLPDPEPEPVRTVFDDLADCESGGWDGDGGHVEGSARWDLPPGDHIFEGGLQFHPATWDGYREPGIPAAAHDATRSQQIDVARKVLDEQGWRAWPVCSIRLGLRDG